MAGLPTCGVTQSSLDKSGPNSSLLAPTVSALASEIHFWYFWMFSESIIFIHLSWPKFLLPLLLYTLALVFLLIWANSCSWKIVTRSSVCYHGLVQDSGHCLDALVPPLLTLCCWALSCNMMTCSTTLTPPSLTSQGYWLIKQMLTSDGSHSKITLDIILLYHISFRLHTNLNTLGYASTKNIARLGQIQWNHHAILKLTVPPSAPLPPEPMSMTQTSSLGWILS